MVCHVNFKMPDEHRRLLGRYLYNDAVEGFLIAGQSHTAWAIFAGNNHTSAQVRSGHYSAHSNCCHSTRREIFFRHLPTIVCYDDCSTCSNCMGSISSCDLATRVSNNGRWGDAPRSQKIYETYLDRRAQWLGELGLVETTGLLRS